ncbi:IPT/TIG domain-containing protein, partial [Patescibacteria group bacterium]|nr:IPT/TIG domain-containing protein [Patescibacteria group bacterium]
MTAAGEEEKITKAKKILIGALIGLIICLASFAIASFVLNKLMGTAGNEGGGGGGDEGGGGGGIDPGGNSSFSINATVPRDKAEDIARNVVIKIFFNKAISDQIDLITLNSNFKIEKIANIKLTDSTTRIENPLKPIEVVPGVVSIDSDRTVVSFKSNADCGDEKGTKNCLSEWSKFKITVNSSSGIKTLDNQSLDCVGSKCEFIFLTNNVIDADGPEAKIYSAQICKDDGTLKSGANTITAWGRDDVGISELQFYQRKDSATINGKAGSAIAGSGQTYQSVSHKYDIGTTTQVGEKYNFSIFVYDLADNVASSSFITIIKPGHCCNDKKDSNETDVDCGGECGACDGAACSNDMSAPAVCNNDLCSSGVCNTNGSSADSCANAGYAAGIASCCLCQRVPVITGISPVGGFCSNDNNKTCSNNNDCGSNNVCNTDVPNGAAGNLITISGRNFGVVKSLFENVLTNVDFEQGDVGKVPTNWEASAQRGVSIGISKDEKKSGEKSVKVHQKPNQPYPGTCTKEVCDNLPGCIWLSRTDQCKFTVADYCHLTASASAPAIYKKGEELCWGNSNRVMWGRLVYNVSNLGWKPGEKYIVKFYYKGHSAVNIPMVLAYSLGWYGMCTPKSDIYIKADGSCVYGADCSGQSGYCCANAPVQKKCYKYTSLPSISKGDYHDWTLYSAMFTYTKEMQDLKNADGSLRNEIGFSIGYNDTGTSGTDLYIDDFTVARLSNNGNVIFLGDAVGTDDQAAGFPSELNPYCASSWQDNQIIITVPQGAFNGPIKVVAENGLETTSAITNIPNFKVNKIKRPGLCLINKNTGSFGDEFALQGIGFATDPKKVFFGNKNNSILADAISGWSNTTVKAKVPNINDGQNSIFVKIAGENSNSLDFTIKNNIEINPVIEYITPAEGPIGQYITIYGRNFKNFQLGTSTVKFYLPADSNTLINANIDFPKQCQGKYWYNTYIIVKVPKVNATDDYKVVVINSDNKKSNPKDFKITTGTPGPGLCLLDPYNGPVNTVVKAYGDYFGSSQGTSRAIFYNNINSTSTSWANQMIETKVPNGAQTGPFTVSDNKKISNGLFFKVGVCSSNNDCLNPSTEECCPSGTYNAGLCKTNGECSLGGPQGCVFGWTFSTAPGVPDVNILTCGGYDTINTCSAANMCPNSPGKCQSKTNIATGSCGDDECNKNTNCNTNCIYSETLNKCKLKNATCDLATTTIINNFIAECQKVENKSIWQVNRGKAACPDGTYQGLDDWCSIGTPGSSKECKMCSSGFICHEGECIISSSGCQKDSTCKTNKCIKNKGACECCCRVTNSAQDCCAGLTCNAGGCGDDTKNYGLCAGCKIIIDGQANQVASDKACNCYGNKSTRYCDLTDSNNPLGACKDKIDVGDSCDNDTSDSICSDNRKCAE